MLVHFARTQVHLKGAEARPAGSGSGFHGRFRTCPAVYHQLLRAERICAGAKCVFTPTRLNSKSCTIRSRTCTDHTRAIAPHMLLRQFRRSDNLTIGETTEGRKACPKPELP